MKFSQIKDDLVDLDVGKIIEDEPLYKHTTYKVGGPARIYLAVKDVESLVKTIKYCRKHRIKYMIIGRGSNLLFSDKEYEELDRTTFIMRRNEIDRQNLQKKLEEERELNSGDDEQ